VLAKSLIGIGLVLLLMGPGPAAASSGTQVYQALGIEVKDVLAGTVLNARVLPGEEKQIACVVTYFTGKREKSDAVNVRLALFGRSGDSLVPLYSRDLGSEQGGYVANGDLQLLDLDRNGTSEIVVCYDRFKEPLIDQRVCEVIVYEESKFRTAWAGPIEYDATRAARDVPPERRDRFVREFDWPNTLRTKGLTLFMTKKVIAVAGERLPEPKIVDETFPLRQAPRDW
jgi:hypothetical protein